MKKILCLLIIAGIVGAIGKMFSPAKEQPKELLANN